MNEQLLYTCRIQNNYTNNTYVKVGYTTDFERRQKELIAHNPHFTYSEWTTYKHKEKTKGLWYDEQDLHAKFEYYRARFDKETMPDGRTEVYESVMYSEMVYHLHTKGYYAIELVVEPSVSDSGFFKWD